MKTVILMSGLDIDGKSSFARQLHDLGSALNYTGIHTVYCSPGTVSEYGVPAGTGRNSCLENKKTVNHSIYTYRTSPKPGAGMRVVDGFSKLVRETGADVAILLGYPDQFRFLRDCRSIDIPCFLWAQFSRPPNLDIDTVKMVALTPKSQEFIDRAGYRGECPVIPHGVDTSLYFPDSDNKRRRLKKEFGIDDRFVVGTVAAHTGRKRLEDIVEAFSFFSANIKSSALVIKTDRVRSLEGVDLNRIVEQKGVSDRAKIITDDFNRERMRDLYNAMDLYLTLSEWEGFCIPVIEAMACGIPVVTHAVQGPGEIVPYKEYMVPAGSIVVEDGTTLVRADTDEAACLLSMIAREPDLYHELKQIGLNEVRMKYDIRIIARLWNELFVRSGL